MVSNRSGWQLDQWAVVTSPEPARILGHARRMRNRLGGDFEVRIILKPPDYGALPESGGWGCWARFRLPAKGSGRLAVIALAAPSILSRAFSNSSVESLPSRCRRLRSDIEKPAATGSSSLWSHCRRRMTTRNATTIRAIRTRDQPMTRPMSPAARSEDATIRDAITSDARPADGLFATSGVA